MNKVLLLTLHQKYDGIANGNLTRNLIYEARSFFAASGYEIKETVIEDGYDVSEELEKFKWADLFFVQSPVYWMGLPWLGKKYIDEVFSGGAQTVTYAKKKGQTLPFYLWLQTRLLQTDRKSVV